MFRGPGGNRILPPWAARRGGSGPPPPGQNPESGAVNGPLTKMARQCFRFLFTGLSAGRIDTAGIFCRALRCHYDRLAGHTGHSFNSQGHLAPKLLAKSGTSREPGTPGHIRVRHAPRFLALPGLGYARDRVPGTPGTSSIPVSLSSSGHTQHPGISGCFRIPGAHV
jgi:hypothetical protein